MPLSGFLPTVQAWFAERVGSPTPPQAEGWGPIQRGEHVLIAAPTGSGKTLAAFLSGLDALFRQGAALPDATQLLYVSPLKALGNDVQKNLRAPLGELRARDPSLPELRVLVRSGDTTATERAGMTRRPPHVLVTTPESLYILLTSEGGRAMLRTVRTVVVDEIHAVAGSKRGAHLALSLERLDALVGERPVQRVGLSATQKPIEGIARFLVGVGRECRVIDSGHRRALDLAVELPEAPLEAVCSHETWDELYRRMAALVREHRTTLVFVNTRKLAERVAARLGDELGLGLVTCHHGSLAKERRLEAEQRLKSGELRALVATASLELGIDVGDVDLVVQVGSTRSIATFLQRVGRAGHGVGRVPKGRLFPLTRDQLVESAALLRAVRRGELDAICSPRAPLDILAQQVVAACVPEEWETEALFALVRRATPYAELERALFDSTCDLHTQGRLALLHRDGVRGRLRATRRARLVAITSGGAIPDTAEYRVLLEPEGTLVGTLDEDFAIESNGGDVFQLGAASWRVLRIEPGVVRVADAQGAPPTVPFWLGEAPARTRELSAEVSRLREEPPRAEGEPGLPPAAAEQLRDYVEAGRNSLGTIPTQRRLVLERFFDQSGGMQLVLHSPYGGRINRALGLALRKRFCRRFGFELQAAANEEAIVISLGPHHSFPLEEVFDYLHPNTAREVLEQALLPAPMFKARWRWNVTRALVVPRFSGGKRVPPPLVRMRAEDALVQAFPAAQACPETLPGGDLELPRDHPLVRQTVEDCLTEAMDVDGFLEVLRGLRDGTIERVAVDTAEPSVFADSILTAQPYAFLDDAPLEERRVQAALRGPGRGRREDGPEPGALDPEAAARVAAEAWPDPRDAEEVHEALSWMGYVTVGEAPEWREGLEALAAQRRVVRERGPTGTPEDARWFAAEASRDPLDVLRGRLEALGPVTDPARLDGGFDSPALLALEAEGSALRIELEGRPGWCARRLLQRARRYHLERLRREIEPVSAACYWRFLARWQHATPEARLEGPQGVLEVVTQLAGFEVPAEEWERSVLPLRVRDYRRSFLDDLTLRGEVVWGRLWGEGSGLARTAPVCLLPRAELETWLALVAAGEAQGQAAPADPEAAEPAAPLVGPASILDELLSRRGAMFAQDLARLGRLLPEELERGLGELVTRGRVTCDSFAGLRHLLVAPSRRRHPLESAGRWSRFRAPEDLAAAAPVEAEQVARLLLLRFGVLFKTALGRERLPVPWRDLRRALVRLELRGEVRGGRFVAGRFAGEQFALPAAVRALREERKREPGAALSVSAADPLNLQGILTPDPRVARTSRERVVVA